MKAPYYLNRLNTKITEKEYEEFHYHYKVKDVISEGYISIKYAFLDRYSNFINYFTEIIYNECVYYYREEDKFITNQSPLFILTSLIDNKITFDFSKFIYWLIENNEENDSSDIKIYGIDNDDIRIILNLNIDSKVIRFINESEYTETDKAILGISTSESINQSNESNKSLSSLSENNEDVELAKEKLFDKQNKINQLKKEVIYDQYKDEIIYFKEIINSSLMNNMESIEEILNKYSDDEIINSIPYWIKEEVFYTIIDNRNESKTENDKEQLFTEYKLFILNLINKGIIKLNTPFIEFFEKYFTENLHFFNSFSNQELLYAYNYCKLFIHNKINSYLNNQKDKFNTRLFNLKLPNKKLELKDLKSLFKSSSPEEYKLITSQVERNTLLSKFLLYHNGLNEYVNFCLLPDNQRDEYKQSSSYLKDIPKLVNTPSQIFSTYSLCENFFLFHLKINIYSEISWEDALRKFDNFTGFAYSNFLKIDDMKNIFSNVLLDLRSYHKVQFKKLLVEKIGLNNEINWYEAQMMLQEDMRYQALLEKDREELFTKYSEQLFERIEKDFIQLVEESDFINKNTDIYNITELDSIIDKLCTDPRGKRMMKYPERRDKHIKAKVKKLKNKIN